MTPGGRPASSSISQHRPGAQLGLLRRLPQHDVAHHRRGVGEVGQAQEVERGDREHEPLERAVLDPVPGARQRLRLHLVHLAHVADVELRGSRPSRRPRRSPPRARSSRGSSIVTAFSVRPPRAAGELGRAQEDRGPVLPGHPRPVLPRLGGGGDRAPRPRRSRPSAPAPATARGRAGRRRDAGGRSRRRGRRCAAAARGRMHGGGRAPRRRRPARASRARSRAGSSLRVAGSEKRAGAEVNAAPRAVRWP